jgi:hypothetical protein
MDEHDEPCLDVGSNRDHSESWVWKGELGAGEAGGEGGSAMLAQSMEST